MKAVTLEELEADYKDLEHELFVLKACDRPITMELMDRAMRIARDVLNRVTDGPDPSDFEEMKKELTHRIKEEFKCAMVEVERIIYEEVK